MLKELWGVSIKVPNLEEEVEFHRQLGNRIQGDYTFELEGKSFRVICVVTDDRAAGQHLFLAETHIIEHLLQETFQYGMTHLIYNNGAWGVDEMKKQASEIVTAGGTLISGTFQLSSDRNNPFFPNKKNPETFAIFLRSPGGYLFELFTLEAFDRMDWIYYPREENDLGVMKLAH